MTDREERQHVIEVLKQMRLDYEDFWEENDTEEIKAFNYAIASIETDLKYDLLYEETSGQADKQADKTTTKNDLEIVMDAMEYRTNALIENIKSEIMHFANAHCSGDDISIYDVFKVIDDCCEDENSTTKNGLGIASGLDKNSKKLERGTTKDNLGVDYLGVDCISRQQAIDACHNFAIGVLDDYYEKCLKQWIIDLPPVTPQEPKTGHCKDCKWWKDSDGAYRRGCNAESKCPINRREVFEGNGYCYLFEPQESEDKE